MNKAVIEGVGLSVVGWEEDYILLEDERRSVGASGILKSTGVEPINWNVVTAFEMIHVEDFKPDAEDYIARTGFKVPPVYRIKITVETEALSEDESLKFWEEKQTRHRNND